MRSAYGKWNEERWLRSFRSDFLGQKKTPAVYNKQKYATADIKKVSKKAIHNSGYPMLVTSEESVNEAAYARDGLEFQISETKEQFLLQIPKDDPYREILATRLDGGADVRWQMNSMAAKVESNGTTSTSKQWANFLMAVDVGMRWRPVHKRYQLVYEGRYLGSPREKTDPQDFMDTLSRRSLYAMADDLPYNTYVQYGYYRPMFGTYTADHTALAQRMLSYALQDTPGIYNLNYQAMSFGGSPNVPFVNLHILGRQYGAVIDEKHKGFVANLGGRFVTLGLALNYSYWRSETEKVVGTETVKPKLEMHAFSVGAQLKRITVTLEGISAAKDVPKRDFRRGALASLDTYTRIWREIYFNLQYAQANQYQDWSPGSSSQYRIGFRGFLTTGVDVNLGVNMESHRQYDGNTGVTVGKASVSSYYGQLHLYM